ncbi:DUF2637 domain-containing protein, partial [Streptomyces anulatus]|uniref:DUF2637 domain-containing protein n=1 Tax=Streptomyces anulatus TaxID=1892 RepID=UPI00053A2C0D
DKHMEGVRLTRWLLSPVPTFKLWRRMKLWELRSYEQVIKLEQDRLIYQARLQARFGRNWRRKAPVESMMPLRLAKYGVPLAETAPAGLAAAGIEPALLPPVEGSRPKAELPYEPQREPGQEQAGEQEHGREQGYGGGPGHDEQPPQRHPHPQDQQHQQPPLPQRQEPAVPPTHDSPWFAAQKLPDGTSHHSAYDPQQGEGLEHAPVQIPSGPGRTRPLGDVGTIGAVPHPRHEEAPDEAPEDTSAQAHEDAPQLEEWSQEDAEFASMAFEVFSAYTDEQGHHPSAEALEIHLADTRNVRHPRSRELLQRLWPEFKQAYVPAQSTVDQTA